MSTLSVVVPIYNVEEFLRPALDSLADQTFTDLDVVMVDDGSTDSSGRIAAEYAGKDERFKLVTRPNGGLSRARNTGVEHAVGEYLTFFDSDDLIPHYAFKTIMATLESTGSDFLTSKAYRLDARGAFGVAMQKESHEHAVLRTNLAETPTLMRDLLPWNKVYRRTFYEAAGLEFPDGLTFEDGPVSVRAHTLAESVDIMSIPMYYWRLRDGVSRSISMQSTAAHFYVDRIKTSLISIDFLKARRPQLLDAFFAMDIRHKYIVMYGELAFTGTQIQQQFMRLARQYLAQVPQHVVDALPDGLRKRVELTIADDLDGLLRLLSAPSPKAVEQLANGERGGAKAVIRNYRPLRMIARYLKQRPADAKIRSAVTGLDVADDRLRLSGYGYVVGLPADGRLTAANRLIWMTNDKTHEKIKFFVRSRPSPEATSSVTDLSWHCGYSGFDATLDLSKLKNKDGDWRYGTWTFALASVAPRGVHKSGLRAGQSLELMDVSPVDVDEDLRVVPVVAHSVMKLRLEKPEAVLSETRVVDGTLRVSGTYRGALGETARLGLCRAPGVPELSVPVSVTGTGGFVAEFPLKRIFAEFGPIQPTPVAGGQDRFQLELNVSASEPAVPVYGQNGMHSASGLTDGGQAILDTDPFGRATCTLRPALPVVDTVAWGQDGVLVMTGVGADHVSRPELVCRHTARKEERSIPLTVRADGSWEARLDPEQAPLLGFTTVALRPGRWRLIMRTRDAGSVRDTDLPYNPEAIPAGTGLTFEDGRYRVTRMGLDALILWVETRRAMSDRGQYNLRELREVFYPTARTDRPLRDVVLYDSFNGKQYSDSPRALHEALVKRRDGLRHVWVTNDTQAPIPQGVETVELNSRAWYEALATSRYVVASTHLPYWFRRRDGQTVAQTWHGIGFKRVGYDIDAIQFANVSYLEKLNLEAPNWSFLISPNSFCTPILKRAFKYDGEILEIGSPRNDLLICGDREAITARLRQDLGIPAGKKIILYAPTWRDNEFHKAGQYKFDLRLDVSKFGERLRDEYVLLVRRHPNAVDDLLGQDSDFVFDVANHPDVRQLLAATDVLISDYSTISLDFANTGRPIIFYTYDLAYYRDQLRGFYFDLENEGPGPVVETTEEVVAALSDLPDTRRRYAKRYENIMRIFGHAEDGHATDRFIERLLRDRK